MKKTSKGQIDLAAFTICTKNYLSFARTLTNSFLKVHPKAKMFVLIIDKIEGYFDPKKENFITIEIDKLKNISHLKSFIFKYDVVGLNTGIKPYFMEYLLIKHRIKKLIYFDTDILVLSNLERVIKLLDTSNIVLTPHIITPYPDDNKIPSELGLLMSGSYNLGFIALSQTQESLRFIKWWQKRTYDGAVHRINQGFFRDQKPIDLILSLFNKVVIIKDVGLNVAYWNLHERNKFKISNGKFFVNGQPLIFYHFSGYLLEASQIISKHQTRFKFDDFGRSFKELFRLYEGTLIKNGYKTSIKWPNYFDYFDNGEKITDEMRNVYWELGKDRLKFGNPFISVGRKSFYNYFFKRQLKVLEPKGVYWIVKKNIFVQSLIASARLILGPVRYEKIARLIVKLFFPKYLDLSPPPKSPPKILAPMVRYPKGVNLFGHLSMDTGVGEAGRSLAKVLSYLDIPISIVDMGDWNSPIKSQRWLRGEEPVYPISIFVTNADVIQRFMKEKLGERAWRDKYNIGYWHWELSSFPEFWKNSFDLISEVWVASDFCLNSVGPQSPVPVVKLPWSPMVEFQSKFNRKDFKLNDEDFIFLFVYDSSHHPERKNILGLVEAFEKANFSNPRVKLIIKTMNVTSFTHPYHKRVLEIIKKNKNIIIFDQLFEREKVLGLIDSCDSYVSLHRSEGFGATIFEAMALGKPVIATGYSGNMDFMNVNNSYLVKYKLISIKQDIGVYKKGQLWADPDINHAAQLMRQVFENYNQAKKVGLRAKQDVGKNYSVFTLGNNFKSRIKAIHDKLDIH